MGQLSHIIYASAATVEFTETDLIKLLDKARKHNHEIGVTGMLLHCQGSFFQVLEGSPKSIDQLYQIIKKDIRHNRITTIIKEPIFSRSFSHWSMAFIGATPQQLASIDGLNDFFDQGTCLAELDRGRAKKLLEAFSLGRWRQSLE